MLKWFPIWILGVMDLTALVVAVSVVITVDLDLLEFLLQKLEVTFEKFLEIGFYT
jgi:hypothetical protein